MKTLIFTFLCVVSVTVIAAVEYRKFDSPQQEQAYQNLTNELRCLVCQNQTIADSNADLAKDLRRQVYEMLQQGKSQQEIVDFMTQRYGDFVMYRPPLKPKTIILWVGPAVFIVIGLVVLVIISRKKAAGAQSVALTEHEEKRIRQLLEQEDDA
ncbi:cytochrome c-type biogenesis protein [methane-oxidizing endosymbiont of Gigantopelta aegis]|uniref:cytochrome c-type biogenesis protein n=1 Tax=methane-oxidizing endosymbiont of Gigantopelta aegis TaxID=2794938 RepID=UPI0018DBD021|nr:cytochrome c-type biogenesis protein [methane-oxidizing endosymbiont of Gigantopelta aegis]